ncbi:MAG: trimethylamine methyltransferase family protein [Desulfococcaceae bacterium]|jgi:trimethylamine--corrinoid protein Co-methyltransferase|nr:trimethylamine methyltransferase family protein [Desulfococcaceae bacterium]
MSTKAQEMYNSGINLEKEYDFEGAKKIYAEIEKNFNNDPIMEKTRLRMEDMDDLIAEKKIYERIDENGKRVLTDIGLNIAENQELMDLLMEADAIDFDNETAVFIPLKRDYIDECLAKCPRKMPGDPGPNTFGTGATPPFLKRPGDDELRQANRQEYEEIVKTVAEYQDVVRIFSLPVAQDRSISLYEVAQLMEKHFPGLKMTATKGMSDEEVLFLKDKDHWVDGTSLITSLAPMGTMVKPFLRSCRSGANLLLLDLAIAGSSAPGSPEGLLTQIHAQVLFMMVIAQTVNPGVLCMHGGIPGVTEAGGDLSYSSPHQPLINAAMARVNTWINKFPSAQSGGSTSAQDVTQQAIVESELSRNSLRKYGSHVIRHAMGALGSLNFFSLDKFIEDCERERKSVKIFDEAPKDKGIIPMYFPEDRDTMAGIKEIAEKGGPKNAEHTLRHVESFMKWENTINERARKKLYYPQLNDTVIEMISRGDVIP